MRTMSTNRGSVATERGEGVGGGFSPPPMVTFFNFGWFNLVYFLHHNMPLVFSRFLMHPASEGTINMAKLTLRITHALQTHEQKSHVHTYYTFKCLQDWEG